MQNCPSCGYNLPSGEKYFYCPNCLTQLRCKQCHTALISGAKGCVMCGTPVGKGEAVSLLDSSNVSSTAINTLLFVENSRGHSREFRASLTNEVGTALGGAALAAIIGGRVPSVKSNNGRSATRDVTEVEAQQLSLLDSNFDPGDSKTVVDVADQIPAALGLDAEKLKQIFRYSGEHLQLMETRLKAANKLDAARRLTQLVLLYALDVQARNEIPRTELNDILRRVGLYDSNTATWIGKSGDLIVENEMVGLRLSGQEKARKVLAEVLDSNIPNKWNLSTGAARGGKSVSKTDEDTENTTNSSNRKNKVFSKDVESWVAAWKLLAFDMDILAALKERSVTQKGFFGLWAITKATNNAETVVSSYKLAQFLYLGLGIKVDERNLERRLQAASGKGSLIKVQSGFQLLTPGVAEVEKVMGFIQSNSPDDSTSNHDEV